MVVLCVVCLLLFVCVHRLHCSIIIINIGMNIALLRTVVCLLVMLASSSRGVCIYVYIHISIYIYI